MDEVENPSLPHAGEASPTLRPIEEDEDSVSIPKPPSDNVNISDTRADNEVQQLRTRPPLKRDSSSGPPPPQPPPAPPESRETSGDYIQDAPDSLTLADLKRIRSSFPNATQAPEKKQVSDYGTVYDFEYTDAQSFPVEIEEWFTYAEDEKERLRRCKAAFYEEWKAQGKGEWLDVTEDVRREYVGGKIEYLVENNWQDDAATALMILVYLGLGVWQETAGKRESNTRLEDLFLDGSTPGSRLNEYAASSSQIHWIVSMVDTLHSCDGLQIIYATLQSQLQQDLQMGFAQPDSEIFDPQKEASSPVRWITPESSLEVWCCLTLLYIFIETARTANGEWGARLKKDIAALEPNLLNFFTQTIAKLRWEESLPIPLAKMLLLSWKTILVTLGGLKDIEDLKTSLSVPEAEGVEDTADTHNTKGSEPLITASPLDYHLFRLEINSKYPAYTPPAPLFPLEPETNSILPPLKHRLPQNSLALSTTSDTIGAFPTISTDSMLTQPVHIATPAPSPPPSPAAGPGGKGGKKQNYQTNQLFPFLYPPLDEKANELGGKAQDLWMGEGRKWEGPNVPSSIEEAAKLFAGRTRVSRGLRQMWDVRKDYMEQERGWKDEEKGTERSGEAEGRVDGMMTLEDLGLELEELKLTGDDGLDEDGEVDGVMTWEELKQLEHVEDGSNEIEEAQQLSHPPDPDEFEILAKPPPNETAEQGQPLPQTDSQRRLHAVDTFYRDSLPHLQSLIIVLLKTVLNNVTDLVTKTNGANGLGLQAGIQFPNEANGANSFDPASATRANGINDTNGEITPADDLDKLRAQEIASKALSGVLLLLLKWFKVNHVLQYEYLCQLLLDSNFVPLILKLWQLQEIGRSCHFRLEREEEEFFAWCKEDSRPVPEPAKNGSETLGKVEEEKEESEDEAMPPPIKLKRDSPVAERDRENPLLSPTSPGDFAHPPEVDELGYPTTAMPTTPIKTYSWRNIYTHINYLRILQKVTRRKTHRALMLVTLKSSNHLKKTLKTPVHLLRYYTLKLFKSQVPFCGRKWRQGNMKIITAVWLSVPAELRDDWLSGGGGGMGGSWVGDVDGTVEDALPLEQGLRSLTFWWNVRCFPEAMRVGPGMGVDGMREEEIGYFERELEKMEGLRDGVGGEEVMAQEEGEEIGVGQGWAGPIEGY